MNSSVLVTQLCPPVCDPMEYSLPGSSLHGILQARILEWLPFPPPGDLPNPGIKPGSPVMQADPLPSEPPGKPHVECIHIFPFCLFLFSTVFIYRMNTYPKNDYSVDNPTEK